jgi:hypothetical protein
MTLILVYDPTTGVCDRKGMVQRIPAQARQARPQGSKPPYGLSAVSTRETDWVG